MQVCRPLGGNKCAIYNLSLKLHRHFLFNLLSPLYYTPLWVRLITFNLLTVNQYPSQSKYQCYQELTHLWYGRLFKFCVVFKGAPSP